MEVEEEEKEKTRFRPEGPSQQWQIRLKDRGKGTVQINQPPIGALWGVFQSLGLMGQSQTDHLNSVVLTGVWEEEVRLDQGVGLEKPGLACSSNMDACTPTSVQDRTVPPKRWSPLMEVHCWGTQDCR